MPKKIKQPKLKSLWGNTSKKHEQLSCSEQKVLSELSGGGSNKAIAISLNMSINTVEKYLSNIYKKLEVTSRTEAILWWLEKNTDFRN